MNSTVETVEANAFSGYWLNKYRNSFPHVKEHLWWLGRGRMFAKFGVS